MTALVWLLNILHFSQHCPSITARNKLVLTGELQLQGWHSPLALAMTHPRGMLTPEVVKQGK